MRELISKLFLLVLAYLALTIFFNVVKSELLLNTVELQFRSIARISSYTSVLINALISASILLLAIYLGWLAQSILNRNQISIFDYSIAARTIVITLIFNEIVKFIMTIIFLPDEIDFIYVNSGNELIIQHTFWWKLLYYLNLAFILIAAILLFIQLNLIQRSLWLNKLISIAVILIILLFTSF